MLLSTFSMQVLPDKFLRKHFVLILVVVSLIILVCLSPFLTLLGFEGGINKILTVSSNRASGISYNLFYVFLIQFVSSIWGPFPNLCFVYNGPFYIYDYYIFLNCILSFYFIFGVFALYTTFHKFMPYIFMYIFLNLLAVIVSVVALDFRFQLTYFPLFTLVSFYGFQEQSKQFSALTNMLCFIVYLIIIAAIIIMYNSRHFT